MTQPDIGAQVRVLIRQSDDHDNAIRALRADVESVRESANSAHRAITRLADVRPATASTGPENDDEAPPDAVSWLLLADTETAGVVLSELEGWLAAVYIHYPGGTLPDCWRRHAWVVEELLALMDAHTEAWDGSEGSPVARVDWHSRHRPGAAERIAKALPSCSLTRHAPVNPADARIVGLVGIDEAEPVIAWWVATHGASAEPAPSPAALAESRAREDAAAQSEFS